MMQFTFARFLLNFALATGASMACEGSGLDARGDVNDATTPTDTSDDADVLDTLAPEVSSDTRVDTDAIDDTDALDEVVDVDAIDSEDADAIDTADTDPGLDLADTAPGPDLADTAPGPDLADTDPGPDLRDTDPGPDLADTHESDVASDVAIDSNSNDGDSVDPDTTDAFDTTDTTDTTDDDTIAVGPIDDLIGLTGDELRAALRDRIDDQTQLGYSPGGAREVMFSLIDARDGRLECIYTGRTVLAENPDAPPVGTAALPAIDTTPDDDCRFPNGNAVPGGCFFNTEHSWPRSLGADDEPAASDLHHLFPTYEMANNRRSNFQFGVTTCVANACTWHEGASELGTDTQDRTVFEVRPRYRGDIARAQFYFAVRYGRPIPDHTEATLRDWHLEDPVDDLERDRNDAIEFWQGNRNPFIDHPDFVDAVFDF